MPPRFVHFTATVRETDRIATFTVKQGTFHDHLVCGVQSVDSLMVTVCSTRFSVQKFYFQPTRCVCACFLWISEQIAIISLHSVKLIGFYDPDGVRLLGGTSCNPLAVVCRHSDDEFAVCALCLALLTTVGGQ